MSKEKRVMVDMSATLIHHGHVRLLKKASKYGKVIVGLTTDEEIFTKKGYQPELDFEYRKEILESIKYVSEVVAVPWLLDDKVIEKHKIDLLVHGNDNSNKIDEEKVLIFSRTEGISSTDIRQSVINTLAQTSSRKILLNPGPATTTYSVKMAQVVDDICPREYEFGDLMEFVSTELTKIVAKPKKYTTVLFGGSGTAVVEAVLSSVVPHDKKVLIVNNGAYGKRMCQIADAYGIEYIEFESSPIEPIKLKKLKKVIKANSDISHLAVIHNETTTGLLNNLDDFGAVAKKYKLELIVDAMSSYGALPISMKKQNITYLCASSNKNIQGMAGVGFVIAKTKMLENLKEIKPRNFYLNLYAQYENFIKTHQMRFTPPVQTLYALKQAIIEAKEEGIVNRHRRYSKSWKTLTDELKKMGLKYLVEDKYHSKIITSIFIPEGVDFNDMHDYLYKRGFTIYPGKVADFNTFRVANIGEIDSKDIKAFLKLFKEYLDGKI
jgi:2-aminoethylphosphonate-pyruvate transaminase